ncbi:membrane protein [Gordonia phage Pickett]|uniref:Membrane protein n=1 Tax=Gordonia phage Pickett TaxID=2910954 RepID=A0AAE8Z1W1_9CAUD|nr:membrane protein [Gordonia phage Pickett]UJD21044.1 membrane protein [Gordonia phage Pickett]
MTEISASAWMNPAALSDIGVVGVVVGMVLVLGLAFARGWLVWGSEISIYKSAAERDAKTIEKLLDTNAKQAQTIAEWNVAGQLMASQSKALRDSLESS